MLVLTRNANQSIIVGDSIQLTVLEIRGNRVRLGIDAPPDVTIIREELARKPTENSAVRHDAGRLRIFIVDDDDVDRRQIRRLLSNNSNQEYAVSEFNRGQEGLQSCRTNPPDCVILDYCLPDINGFEFLSALRDRDGGTSIPVLLISGQKSNSIRGRSLNKGAQGFLTKKEMSHRTLYSAINNAIRHCSSN